ncbi:MAG TPA: FkbM family methyltransferase [Gemmatimonadaceae bacterium]|nr:FkbM family methyltransferase [Gemmatimonadaceae bacterium]
MSLLQTLAALVPTPVRRRCLEIMDTEFRGVPLALRRHPGGELRLTLDMVLAHYRMQHPNVCYLQIGAFDGIAGDPIYALIDRHALRGILVEPQRRAFDQLKTNYARFDTSRFVFINAAVAAENGSKTLYRVAPADGDPEWLPQLASFDRQVIASHAHLIPNLESRIAADQVRCVTVSTLLEEAGVERIDLLQIDAEGYDAEILRLFDVPRRRPAIVRFEHKHLSRADHDSAVESLLALRYQVAIGDGDTLAYRATDGAP